MRSIVHRGSSGRVATTSKLAATAIPHRLCSSAPSTSFAAGLFRVKIVSKELFPYPKKAFTEEEGDSLESIVRNVQTKKSTTTEKDVVEWGTAGASIQTEYGGLQLSETALSVALEELARNAPIHTFAALIRHVGSAAYLLKSAGSKEVKARYLCGMSDASIRIAWAVTEEHAGIDVSMNTALATPQGDGSYTLSGTKVVSQAANATHFLVMARAPTQSVGAEGPVVAQKATFFIIERGAKGVSVSAPSVDGVHLVSFNNALVHDVVGSVGEGHVQYTVTLHSCHHLVSAVLIGLMKKALSIAVASVKTESDKDATPLKAWIASATAELYALESTIFALTANLDVPVADSLIEATLSSSLVTRTAHRLLEDLTVSVQNSSLFYSPELAEISRESRQIFALTESPEFLDACAACCGIEDFGLYFQKASTLETIQNRSLRSMGIRDKLPVAATTWAEYQKIEECVVTFGAAVEHVFVKQNVRLRHQTLTLSRIAESASLLYASAASAARVLMAEKKGVPSAKTEKRLASLFIAQAMTRVNYLCDECRHSGKTADEALKRIAMDVAENAYRAAGGKPTVAAPVPPPTPAVSAGTAPAQEAAESKPAATATATAAADTTATATAQAAKP